MNRSHRRGNGIVAIALAGALALPLAATARPPGGHARGLESRIEQLDLDAETSRALRTRRAWSVRRSGSLPGLLAYACYEPDSLAGASAAETGFLSDEYRAIALAFEVP